MSISEQFGVDVDSVDSVGPAYPPVVPGRVAQIDADFMSYQVSALTKEEREGKKTPRTLNQMCIQAEKGLDHLMRMVGAERYVAHITPSGSDKGGRDGQAVTLPYQGNRKDRERPRHLDLVRHHIGVTLSSAVNLDQEADDSMAQANTVAVLRGERELSVIVSRDKDLRMVEGLHWCFDKKAIVDVHGFGSIWLDDSGSTKKVKGWGTSFFWAQLLMGDTADNIKGLPFITHGALWALDRPPVSLVKLLDKLKKEKRPPQATAIEKLIKTDKHKLKPCGAVMAYELLAGCKTDKECYDLIRGLFIALGESRLYKPVHHETQQPTTVTKMMFGDMLLLWMRRRPGDRMEVLTWLKSEVL